MRWHSLNLFILFFVGLSRLCAAQLPGYNSRPDFDPTVMNVSIIQLIANPQAYDEKTVQFIGFLNLEFEGNAVYLHVEDFDRGITHNAIWINVPKDMTKQQQKAVNRDYVICAGVFHADRHGHMGMFGGELSDVRRIESWAGKRKIK